MSAEFVPSVFRELGKPVADLLSRKYKYDKSFKARTRTADGLTITGDHNQGSKGITSKVSARYEDLKNFGIAEADIDTNSAFKGTLKLTQLAKGFTVKAIAEQHPQGSVDVDYKQANVAVTLSGACAKPDAAKDATGSFGGALVVGFEGASVGAAVSRCIADGALDTNFGAQYAAKDYEVSLKTSSNASKATIFGQHKYSSAVTVGATIDLDISSAKKGDEKEADKAQLFGGLSFGGQYKHDADTTFQGKFKTCGGADHTVAVVAERTLTAQSKLTVVSEFGYSAGSVQHKNFGIALVLGELNLTEL